MSTDPVRSRKAGAAWTAAALNGFDIVVLREKATTIGDPAAAPAILNG